MKVMVKKKALKGFIPVYIKTKILHINNQKQEQQQSKTTSFVNTTIESEYLLQSCLITGVKLKKDDEHR